MLRSEDIVLVGHPFAPIGRGEDVRSAHRAFRAHGLEPKIVDIYRLLEPEGDWKKEFSPHLARKSDSKFALYFLNGDEVEQSLDHLNREVRADYSIVYPAWELEQYPESWGKLLNGFDETWAMSQFVLKSLEPVVKKPVHHIPLAVQPTFERFVGRDAFGIPGDAFVFLFFFDFKSYASRKNPWAVVEAFQRLTEEADRFPRRPMLVVKSNHPDQDDPLYRQFSDWMRQQQFDAIWIEEQFSDAKIKNLVRNCDAFVSLHRSEGFGRGLAEAMCLGKLAIGTGYSGNLDYMNSQNSMLVAYELVDCKRGEYPHAEGQRWAAADVGHAAELMSRAIRDETLTLGLGARAKTDMRRRFSYLAIGKSYLDRLEAVDRS
jgi:glycosyltransferase involved in cell wall biosynthesis